MEAHGKNPIKNVVAVIPARYLSTRLEGKLLLPLNGKPLILHTLQQAKKASNVSRVIVATDDARILRVVEESGNEAVMTSTGHQSGSDRIAEVAKTLPEGTIVVNVQGDEPLVSPQTIEKAVDAILNDGSVDIATTCEKISDIKDVLSPNVVKVVSDENGNALYFSRSPIPFPRDAVSKYGDLESALNADEDLITKFRKHTGLYVYRREYLLEFTGFRQSEFEKIEMLEQLRALENGAKIRVVETEESSVGVDTQEDFSRIKEILEESKSQPEEVTFRIAKKDDIPEIARIHVESWQKSFPGIVPQGILDSMSIEKRTESLIELSSQKEYQTIVAQNSKGEIIGFADFGEARNKDFEFESELYAIYFLKEYQKRGIGSKLFRAVISEIKKGSDSMYLEVLEINPYKNFYDKMGGKFICESENKNEKYNCKTQFYGWKGLKNI